MFDNVWHKIVAMLLTKVYRIPANSVSFAFSGLDFDLYQAEQKDLLNLSKIQKEIVRARKNSKRKNQG